MKLLLAIDSVDSARLVAGSVASRPWGAGTRTRVLTVIDYALVPDDLASEAGGSSPQVIDEQAACARMA